MTLLARNLTVAMAGVRILDDVSVAFEPGALVGLLGPNGAGKSTLIRALAGLQPLASGEVEVDGRPLAALREPERARLIGYMPQSFAPAWDYSVRDVLEIGAARVRGGRARLPDIIGQHELVHLVDRRWSRLSGGERARALLGSVLVADPPALLADEPGASLDLRHRLSLLDRLRARARTRTVVVAMHDLDLAIRYCDVLVVLESGRVTLSGASAEVVGSEFLDTAFSLTLKRVRIETLPGVHVLPIVSEVGYGRATGT